MPGDLHDSGSSSSSNTTSRRQLPPRRRWAGRSVVAAICAIFVTPFAAGWWERASFYADVEARHRRGEPVLVDDFKTPFVLPDQNAATYLNSAAEEIHFNNEQERVTDNITRFTFGPDEYEFAQHVLSSERDRLEQVRRARKFAEVNWHVALKTPVMWNLSLKHVSAQRQLTLLLFPVAVYQHDFGDDAEAVETARDIVMVGRAVDQQPFLTSHLVSAGIDSMAADLCIRIAPTLRLAPASALNDEGPPERPVDLAEVRTLIRELLDDGPRLRAAREAWQRERMVTLDFFCDAFGKAAYIAPYAYYSDTKQYLASYDDVIWASQALDWKTARSRLTTPKPRKYWIGIDTLDPLRPLQCLLQITAERRIAAIALALRLYAVDHGGRWPATLDELVPGYLESIPFDPFADDGHAIRYINQDPPVLYSVGDDGRDGHADRTGGMKYGFYDPWLSRDAVFPLGGMLRPAEEKKSMANDPGPTDEPRHIFVSAPAPPDGD